MKEPTNRQWRWIEYLNRFKIKLVYLKDDENIVADFLSRISAEKVDNLLSVSSIAPDELILEQEKNLTLHNMETTSLHLEKRYGIITDISCGFPRILLPKIYRLTKFERIHKPSHPGAKRMI